MFAEIFQRQGNEVKECGLTTVNEVRASKFFAGDPKFLATPLGKNYSGQKSLIYSSSCSIDGILGEGVG